MKLGLRRLLYSLFILIFLIAAPLIIMYASGYRYNFRTHRLQKTGLLIIETKPKDALIYLDNKLKKMKTPAELKSLLPGEYEVKIEKNGYYPWSKKLKVESNQTTFANNIILFKISLPALLKPGKIFWAKAIPNQNKLIYLTLNNNQQQLKIFNLEDQNEQTVYESSFTSPLNSLAWSSNNKKLLVKNGADNYLIINTETQTAEFLDKITAIKFEKVSWDKVNSQLLYGLKKNTLYQIDLLSQTVKPILANYLEDFYAISQNLYYLTKTNQAVFLNRQILNSDSKPSSLKLPVYSTYQFKTGSNELLAIADYKNNKILMIKSAVFDQENKMPANILMDTEAKEIIWSKNYQKAILFNDFEIYVYEVKNNYRALITRLSQPIKNAEWLPGENYLVYLTDKGMAIVETGPDVFKNNYQIAGAEKIDYLIVDKKGERLYFTGRIGNQEGIFELEIN